MKITERFLFCDGCGDVFGVDSRHKSFAQHREDAANDGWIAKGEKDYCKGCVEQTNEKGAFYIGGIPLVDAKGTAKVTATIHDNLLST